MIDFGIGKVFDPSNYQDSLVAQINRAGSDTLPQEYYSGEYTSLTDMFYLAELMNRLMVKADNPDEMNFSYQEILEKMMRKQPAERYKSFSEIKEAIDTSLLLWDYYSAVRRGKQTEYILFVDFSPLFDIIQVSTK